MTNSETKNFSQNVSSSYHLGGKCSGECKNDSLNVPKLRFKGYNYNYDKIPLKNISTRIKRVNSDSTAPTMMISANCGFIMQSEKYSRDNAGKSLTKYTIIHKGELAYNHGASKAKPYGCCFQIDVDEARIPYVYHCFKIDKNNYAQYIALYLNNKLLERELRKLVSSSVRMDGLLNISYEDYTNIKLNLPRYEEQKKIASFLTLIDKKIEKQKELVELLKKYKRGLLSQIFSQKLRFKDDNGNYYPNWEEKRLGDICKIVGGGTPDTKNVEYWGDDINWFTPTEIIKKYAYSSNRKISKLGLLKSSAKILPIGTVLLTTRATLGEMSILSIEATTNQGFQSLIPVKDEVSSEFIYYCQPIIKHFCYKYANGSTFLEISKQTLAKLKLMIPNKDEQNKISEFLSKFDDKIQQEESLLNYLQIYKKGLLQQLFI